MDAQLHRTTAAGESATLVGRAGPPRPWRASGRGRGLLFLGCNLALGIIESKYAQARGYLDTWRLARRAMQRARPPQEPGSGALVTGQLTSHAGGPAASAAVSHAGKAKPSVKPSPTR